MATNSRFVLILILSLTILIAIPAAEAVRIVSAVNGDWDVAGTWTGGVPSFGEGVLNIPINSGLRVDPTSKHLYLTFGNVSGGHSKAIFRDKLSFVGARLNPVTIQGANAMHHPIIDNASEMAWDSASDGFVLNLKWLNLHTNSTSNDANMLYGGDGITYNITGNISISGNVVILSNNNFNATQPNTNLSVTGTTGPGVKGWTIGGNITIKGSPSQGYILFTGHRGVHFNSLGPHNIQYANFQGRNVSTSTSGLLIQHGSGFPIYTIDNITVNSTDKYGYSGLAL